MTSKSGVIHFVMGMIETGDADLLEQNSILSLQICNSEDRPTVREIARLLKSLHDDFDYTKSPEFLTAIAGKSDAYQAMKMRLVSQPAHETENQVHFNLALHNLLASREAFELVPENRHADLTKVIELAESLSNPDQEAERRPPARRQHIDYYSMDISLKGNLSEGFRGNAEDLAAAERAIDDSHIWNRLAGVVVLAKLGAAAERALTAVETLASDKNAAVRLLAEWAAARIQREDVLANFRST